MPDIEGSRKPNAVDTARGQIEKALGTQGNEFNGAKVMVGLDRLQKALTDQGYDPISMFTELGSHAATARNVLTAANDQLQAGMFEMRAANYMSTLDLLKKSAESASHVSPVEEGVTRADTLSVAPRVPKSPRRAATRTSAPTVTDRLPSTNSPKS